ncbi:MAG: F0F1 ATP synthase subunit epsilon [Planctomycetes bacterium]|jgi:F-type H+-transporting ATPase subunit epsilon|nr:F0F1 ATP synthase subunit epsilon [Phycisphaerae bacterium]NBB95140.1 F0F1 ATP synthase subunit epsilon [Planctomycetota bacterium]
MSLDHDTRIHCEVHTPDGPALEGEYVSINVPARDGYMGILRNRAPVTAAVGAGQMTLNPTEQGEPERYFVAGGFLQVRDNQMTVLTEECVALNKLDAEEAWNQLQDAYKLPNVTDEQEQIRDEAIRNARIKFSLAQKARKAERSSEDVFSKGL